MMITAECNEAGIREALEALRKASADERVLHIKPGTGAITQTIRLDGRDRGLIIEGAGQTVLTGGVTIHDWRSYGDGLVCADLPAGADPAMLLVNGRLAELACFPEHGRLKNLDVCRTQWKNSRNGGWNRPLNDYELTHMTVNPSDLPPGFEPANAVVTHFHQWDESTVRIQGYDAATGVLSLASRMEHPAGAFGQHDYVLRNIREGLTHAGQWMCDRVNQLVIYWPIPEDGQHIIASLPLVESIFSLTSGADQVTFRNLTLTLGNGGQGTPGLRAVNEPGLIQADDVHGTVLEAVRFQQSAGSGVRLYRSSDYEVKQCAFQALGAGGVVALESCEAQILNNVFTQVGMRCASANPILAGGYSELVYVQLGSRPEVGRTVIAGNRIQGAPYCGVVCCGEGHEILGNQVSDTMQVLHDGAGIYVSRGHLMRIADNQVSAPTATGVKQAHAIYLDELSWNCVVEHNTMEGSVPFLAHLACQNTLRNNVIRNQGPVNLEFVGCTDFTLKGNQVLAEGPIQLNGLPRESYADNEILSNTHQIQIEEDQVGLGFFEADGQLMLVEKVLAQRAKSWKRILFLGDSITVSGWYLAFFQLYCSCRFPHRDIEILNGGISGQRAEDAVLRLDEDVIARHPDVVIICFGINDLERALYGERTDDPDILQRREAALDVFNQSMTELYNRLKAAGIQVMGMTPCAYDEYGAQEEENLTVCNSLGVTSLVHRLYRGSWNDGVPIIDLFMPTSRLYAAHPELQITHDRVHPDKSGHLLIANVIAQNLFPEPADGPGLPFPIPEDCLRLEPYVSFEALRNTGGKDGVDTRGLLVALEAWKNAEAYSRSFMQTDYFLKKNGYDPAAFSEEDIQKLVEIVSPKYEQYYRNLLGDYVANRMRRDTFKHTADQLKQTYLEQVHALRRQAGI